MQRRKFFSSAITAALTVPLAGNLKADIKRASEVNVQAHEALLSADNFLFFQDGMPIPLQWFTDDRLSFEMDALGITRVTYQNPLSFAGNPFIFYRRLFDGFRLYIERDHVTYSPQLKNYSFLPCGFRADWVVQGVVINYSVFAVEESIVFTITLPENCPAGLDCKLECYDSFALTPNDKDDFMYSDWGAERRWEKWHFDAESNSLGNRFTESPTGNDSGINNADGNYWESFLNVCITANFQCTNVVREHNVKRILRNKEKLQAGQTYSYIISFIHEEDAVAKTKSKLSKSQQTIQSQVNHYKAISERNPILISKHKQLDNFMALAPLFMEALKVKSIPGAIRSNNINYWVWGWDGMTGNNSLCYWGDADYLKQMLGCYSDTAHPERGIVHAFKNDMSIALYSPTTSQSIYISLLYLYYCQTQDLKEVKKRYAFSKSIFEKVLKLEVRDTGFCEGTSLFPDFPKFMKETGNDVSLFNNTLFYSACRSMECLAILMGDTQTRDKARAVFMRFEKNFLAKFFNEERGFFVSSIDSLTLEQRDSYNLSAVKWDIGFFADLVDPVSEKAMRFMSENLVGQNSLREIPLWNECFDGDANQLHCWFTANAQYFIRTANQNNRADLLSRFKGWVEYWTRMLTVPEAINYYAENEMPEHERWNSASGVCQLFGAKEWYLSVMHGIVGMDTGPGGITFFPYDGEEMTLLGVHYRAKLFDIEMKGSGKYISTMEVNGVHCRGTNIVPIDMILLSPNNRIRIKVYRTQQQQMPVFIKSGYGIELHDYTCTPKGIRSKIAGIGTCNVKLHAKSKPVVLINGRIAAVSFYPEVALAIVKLVFDDDTKKTLEVGVA